MSEKSKFKVPGGFYWDNSVAVMTHGSAGNPKYVVSKESKESKESQDKVTNSVISDEIARLYYNDLEKMCNDTNTLVDSLYLRVTNLENPITIWSRIKSMFSELFKKREIKILCTCQHKTCTWLVDRIAEDYFVSMTKFHEICEKQLHAYEGEIAKGETTLKQMNIDYGRENNVELRIDLGDKKAAAKALEFIIKEERKTMQQPIKSKLTNPKQL